MMRAMVILDASPIIQGTIRILFSQSVLGSLQSHVHVLRGSDLAAYANQKLGSEQVGVMHMKIVDRRVAETEAVRGHAVNSQIVEDELTDALACIEIVDIAENLICPPESIPHDTADHDRGRAGWNENLGVPVEGVAPTEVSIVGGGIL